MVPVVAVGYLAQLNAGEAVIKPSGNGTRLIDLES